VNKKYIRYKNITGKPEIVEQEVNHLLDDKSSNGQWEPYGTPHMIPSYADKVISIMVQPMVLVQESI